MKKIILLILTFFSYTSLNALSLGNPLDPDLIRDGWFTETVEDPCSYPCDWSALSFRTGFYGDYVFNRHMRIHEKNDHSVIDITRIFTNAGYFALNVWNRVDIFATLGATDFDLHTSEGSFFVFADPAATFDMETTSSFSWSLGVRAILMEYCGTILGIEGQYFQTNPKIRKALLEGFAGQYVSAVTHYNEWQIGLGIAHPFGPFVPYAGVKWAHSLWSSLNKVVITDFDTIPEIMFSLRDLKNQKHWGYAVGLSIRDCEPVSFTIEGRFADEKALYLNAQIRF